MKKSEIPKTRGLKEMLFSEFENLENTEAIKIEPKILGYTVSGCRFVVAKWNKTHEEKLKTKIVNSRKDSPIIFIFKGSEK